MYFNKIKQLTATALGRVFPLEFIFKVSRNRYILTYHRVLPVHIAQKFRMQPSMWISINTFNDDVAWMKDHGDVVDLDTLLDFDAPNTRPLFSITFDDGWLDNYVYAFPILKNYNVTATVFLVTNAIETGQLFWVEDFLYKLAQLSETAPGDSINNTLLDYYSRLGAKSPNISDTALLAEGLAELLKSFPEEKRSALLSDLYNKLKIDPVPMSDQLLKWSDIIEMSQCGIEFGSHTHTHQILQYADNDIIEEELSLSKDIISEKLGKPVKFFCYPNARYRLDNADLIEKAGYEYAFRIHNLCSNKHRERYFIPRYLLNERTCHNKNYLLCKLLNIPKF